MPKLYILTLLAVLLAAVPLTAQTPDSTHVREFSVAEFRALRNDISAFVSPVYDLNNDACAMIKVVGPEELAFSTPLGIVKRLNEVGEVWLYLPQNSKRITIKHPLHGVIRDYCFPQALESRMTYELTLNLPRPVRTVELQRDTVVLTHVVTETLRDTIIRVPAKRPPLPQRYIIAAGTQMNRYFSTPSIFLATLRRHGAFVHLGAMPAKVGATRYDCLRDGTIDGTMPYYTGAKRRSAAFALGGIIHRLSPHVMIYEGAGYARYTTAWELAASEGGGYVRNKDLSHSGVALEFGLMYAYKRLNVSAWGMNTAMKEWHVGISIGINLGKL